MKEHLSSIYLDENSDLRPRAIQKQNHV